MSAQASSKQATDPGPAHLAVRDASPGSGGWLPPTLTPRGCGLLLVEQLATAWGINRHPNGGKAVWGTINLSPPCPSTWPSWTNSHHT